MGPSEHPPVPTGAQTIEAVLQDFAQQLRALHRSMLRQLTQDLERLAAEQAQLTVEIDRLQQYRQRLQAQPDPADRPPLLDAASQEWAQQWAKQLAQHMGAYLKRAIDQRFDELAAQLHSEHPPDPHPDRLAPPLPYGAPIVVNGRLATTPTEQGLIELDRSLQTLFDSLQRELAVSERELTQRLGRLASLQGQDERLLEDLDQRLRSASPALPAGPPAPISAPSSDRPTQSAVKQGFFFALAAAAILALFNVVLKLMLQGDPPETLLGLVAISGVITPTLGNALLILLLRTLAIALVFPWIASWLYGRTWTEIRRLVESRDGRLWAMIGLNGLFLFASQVLLYLAIGAIPTGVAMTLFSLYPIVTVALSWLLWSDQPSLFRIVVMGFILIGGGLALPDGGLAAGDRFGGTLCALGAGVAFAGYLLTVQRGTKTLHPVPFTLLSFFCTFGLTCLGLILGPEIAAIDIDPLAWPELLTYGGGLGLLTLVSYLLNNLAVRSAGATLAAIVSASGNALTAVLAWILIQETLKAGQWLGIGLVTASVMLLSAERLIVAKRSP